jgi:hypothetical protein
MGVEASLRASRHGATPAMSDDSPLAVHFPAVSRKKVTDAFDGGRLASDIGWRQTCLTDASPTSSRTPAHGSGPMWIATPSLQWTCTTYSLPVYRRTLLSPPRRRFVGQHRASMRRAVAHRRRPQLGEHPPLASRARSSVLASFRTFSLGQVVATMASTRKGAKH